MYLTFRRFQPLSINIIDKRLKHDHFSDAVLRTCGSVRGGFQPGLHHDVFKFQRGPPVGDARDAGVIVTSQGLEVVYNQGRGAERDGGSLHEYPKGAAGKLHFTFEVPASY